MWVFAVCALLKLGGFFFFFNILNFLPVFYIILYYTVSVTFLKNDIICKNKWLTPDCIAFGKYYHFFVPENLHAFKEYGCFFFVFLLYVNKVFFFLIIKNPAKTVGNLHTYMFGCMLTTATMSYKNHFLIHVCLCV